MNAMTYAKRGTESATATETMTRAVRTPSETRTALQPAAFLLQCKHAGDISVEYQSREYAPQGNRLHMSV